MVCDENASKWNAPKWNRAKVGHVKLARAKLARAKLNAPKWHVIVRLPGVFLLFWDIRSAIHWKLRTLDKPFGFLVRGAIHVVSF